jgi:hypothetical protein
LEFFNQRNPGLKPQCAVGKSSFTVPMQVALSAGADIARQILPGSAHFACPKGKTQHR